MIIATGGMSMNNLKALLFSKFTLFSNVYTIARDKHIFIRNSAPIMYPLIILFGFTGFLNGFSIFYNAG